MDVPARIRDVFSEAMELPAERRGDFLREACGADLDLRGAVESLLAAHERAGDFLAEPEVDAARFMGAAVRGPGTKIGPYTIVRLIGEGGYGVVYLAHQESPVRRQVALKLIKPGMDSRPIIARFEAERQALALMEHSNIARVFDAGTSDGHPYFVMEYVEGTSITEFCRGLAISAQLALFTKVCMAVQHAHQKGIIHRDLKPTNILVAIQDGMPTPKIIDFGIAKVLGGPMSGETMLTGRGQFLGTPQYISPEQAGAAPDVDTRTDIYSLGSVLYEILTGKPAFDLHTLRSAAGAELERMIREVDPPWPSARLRAMGNAPTEKTLDAKTTLKLAQTVRGELDWIVMKAMEKDRDRRYETAERLGNDILRYLADEPVAAGPPSRRYRFSKFARRNRTLLVSVGMVLVILAGGFAVTTVALVRANREGAAARTAETAEAQARLIAEQQRAAAMTNEAEAKTRARNLFRVQTFLYRLLNPAVGPPPAEFLDYAAVQIMSDEFAEHPEVLAPVHEALGSSYQKNGMLHEAEREYRRAMAALAETGDETDLASEKNNTATILIEDQKYDAAEVLLRDALATYRRLYRGDNEIDAPVLENLALVLEKKGNFKDAQPLLESAIGFYEKADRKLDAAQALNQLADVLTGLGKPDEAAKKRAEAMAYHKGTEK